MLENVWFGDLLWNFLGAPAVLWTFKGSMPFHLRIWSRGGWDSNTPFPLKIRHKMAQGLRQTTLTKFPQQSQVFNHLVHKQRVAKSKELTEPSSACNYVQRMGDHLKFDKMA